MKSMSVSFDSRYAQLLRLERLARAAWQAKPSAHHIARHLRLVQLLDGMDRQLYWNNSSHGKVRVA